MRAAYLHGPGDIRVDNVPDARIEQPTDAVVRILHASICGTDLHPYRQGPYGDEPAPMGHEFIGIIEDLGKDVEGLKRGDVVVSPFSYSDGTCEYCIAGLHTACTHGGFLAANGVGGAQAEAIRVPLAEGTLVRLPFYVDGSLMASLLTLADVYGTGHHAARLAGIRPGHTVAVIGDGAVGLLAVLSARRQGAERIILFGRHTGRTDLGRDYGATDVISNRGDAAANQARELTRGRGVDSVIEAVGTLDAFTTASAIIRPGGTISRIGAPQYDEAPIGFTTLFGRNITLTGGPAPVRAYTTELLPDVLSGAVNPGRVFNSTESLDEVATGYQKMADRVALKSMITLP